MPWYDQNFLLKVGYSLNVRSKYEQPLFRTDLPESALPSLQWRSSHWSVPVQLLPVCVQAAQVLRPFCLHSSNSNASETKANESFDNGVFFDISNTYDSKQIIFETKQTH
jgi:hypothetical protein